MLSPVWPLAVIGAALAAIPEFQPPTSLAPLVEAVKGAVVNVDVEVKGHANPHPGLEDVEGPLGGHPRGGREPVQQGQGSGFVIDPKGLVLTNNHVVEGAISIRVRFDDGRILDADVLGRDPLTDVALLKIRGKVQALPCVKLGDSDAVRVGDWVLAIGNPMGLGTSVSAGIISARSRDLHNTQYDEFLQTDAAINPGNSGGPLFNTRGEVVGINAVIIGIGTGLGFAIPINLARAILPQLENRGAVMRGWLGVAIQDLTPDLGRALGVPGDGAGAVVGQVNPGSPADKAGLREDDVVVALDGNPIRTGGHLSRTVALRAPGIPVVLAVYRAGKRQDLTVTLGTRPDLEGLEVATQGAATASPNEATLGLQTRDLDPAFARAAGMAARGALIVDVAPASAAERAGLAHGMVVIEVAGKPVKGAADLASQLKAAHSGEVVLLRIQTPGARMLRALTLP